MIDRVTAVDTTLNINPLSGFSADQIQTDWGEISRWQVFDRTMGREFFKWEWEADEAKGIVPIDDIAPYHEYIVNTFPVLR